jgi:hypothetical protein
MSLPPAAATRQLHHRRQIDVQVYARDDGLWEVDATVVDVRPRPTTLAGQVRSAGHPIHDMLLRLVVDTQLTVLACGAETRGMPYVGQCDAHGDAYGRLVGLNLARGFRDGVRDRVGGVQGCTHITELAQVLPTAVIQAFAGTVIDTRGHGDEKPFQLDRCHALRSDGDAVRVHYARWYRPSPSPTPDSPRSTE